MLDRLRTRLALAAQVLSMRLLPPHAHLTSIVVNRQEGIARVCDSSCLSPAEMQPHIQTLVLADQEKRRQPVLPETFTALIRELEGKSPQETQAATLTLQRQGWRVLE